MIEIRERYNRVTIIHHVCANGDLWGITGRRILRRRSGHTNWEVVAVFPFRPPRDRVLFSRMATRAFRADKANVYVNSLGTVVGIRRGAVYRISGGTASWLGEIQSASILQRAIAEDTKGRMYFGEYFRNSQRIPVKIWRISADGTQLDIVYEFSAGEIRHVHTVFVDPYEPDTFWVTTGDDEGECFLYRGRSEFKDVSRCGDGTQICRAVNLFFTKDHVSWLTDSHVQQNHAVRMERSTGQIQVGQEIEASAWYGFTGLDGRHVGFTTVEDGPGILTNHCNVMASDDAFVWETVGSFKKDFWRPYSVFRYGAILIPSGQMSSDDFYLSGEAVVGLEGKSFRVAIR